MWNDEGIVRVISHKNNGHPVLYQAVQTRHGFKNNTFILILKHFQKQVKTLTKNNLKYEAVLQYLNKTLRLNGSIRGTAGRVSII